MAVGDTAISRFLEFYGARLPNHRGKWWIHQRLRHLFHVRISGEREVIRSGLRWCLDPSDYVQADLFWMGIKDCWEMHHIQRLLSPGAVVFDVGANFGYYSVTLAARTGCRAYAFEPNPTTFRRLDRNIQLNHLENRAWAYCMGLSNAVTTAHMEEREGNSGMARVVADATTGPEIALTTLDDFVAQENLDRLDFMKIDTEGFEHHVLGGGMQTLTRFKPAILIELNPPMLARQGVTVEPVVRMLRECGYAFYSIERRKLLPMIEPDRLAPDEYVNAFCIAEKVPAAVAV